MSKAVRTGTIIETGSICWSHDIENGKRVGHGLIGGEHCGIFCWEYPDGRRTRWYSQATAPKWLREIYMSFGMEEEAR